MNSWKCLEPNCGNVWSEREPIVCPNPKCNSTNFVKNGNGDGGKINWNKTLKIASGILGFIILILILRGCPTNEIVAKITFKQNSNTLKVELDIPRDYYAPDFVIELLRGGSVYEKVKGLKSKTFTELSNGTYYINVKYLGRKKDKPIIKYDKSNGPFIVNPDSVPIPQCAKITITRYPAKYNCQTNSYKLKIIISPVSMTQKCEYSVDGSNFQDNNNFNVNPGNYKIVVRCKEDETFFDGLDIVLNKPQPPISETEIQNLLDKISGSDNAAFNTLSSSLNTQDIIVTGAGVNIDNLFRLMQNCFNGNFYKVNSIQKDNCQITNINVSEKK